MGFIRKTGMTEMLNQEIILYHLEQAYYGGYTTTDLRLGYFLFYVIKIKYLPP